MSDQNTIDQLQTQVRAQETQIRNLEQAGKRAGAVTAIIGLLSAVGGIVATLVVGVIVVNDELRTWEKIKAAHLAGTEINPVYDHSKLVGDLGLPDFSTFALKSEIPAQPDLSRVVRYGDSFAICGTEGCLFGSNAKSDELDITLAGIRQPWKLEKQ